MVKLNFARKFDFQINGKLINLSAVQHGALEEYFDDGVALNAHPHVPDDSELHVIHIHDSIKSLGELRVWLTNLLRTLNEIQVITEKAEKEIKEI